MVNDSKNPLLQYTSVGTGYYATRLIGNLHADRLLPLELASFIDIQPNIDSYKERRLFRERGYRIIDDGNGMTNAQTTSSVHTEIPIFKSLSLWKKYNAKNFHEHLVDICLRAHEAPKAAIDYIQAGVKQLILPKPFTFDRNVFEQVLGNVIKHRVKAAVASNWYYSDMTAMTRTFLKTAQNYGYSVLSAEINYSKRLDAPRNPPTHDELPHAIELAASTGLVNMETDQPFVYEAEKLKVGIKYTPKGIKEGVKVTSYTDTLYDTHSKRERILKVYLDDGDSDPDIIADVDVEFDNDGKLLHGGSVSIDLPEYTQTVPFEENTLLLMYRKIAMAMKQSHQDFHNDLSVLSIERYAPTLRQIIDIHHQWSKKLGVRHTEKH